MPMILAALACSPDYGVHPTWYTDGSLSYTEGEAVATSIDVVAIVDKSCSMDYERDMLVDDTMPEVLYSLEQWPSLDWRIGIRETEEPGELLGWVDQSTPDALLAISSMFEGDSGSTEAGLGSAVYSMINDDIRVSSDLHFVVVSDERDSSMLATAQSYRSYASAFRSDPWGVTMSAIIYRDGTEARCMGGGDVGYGYIDAADSLFSLCEPDTWDDSLVDAARAAAEKNLFWVLDSTPVSWDEIGVQYDGLFIDRDWWMYHSDGNYIEIDSDHGPDAGTLVTIVYVEDTAP